MAKEDEIIVPFTLETADSAKSIKEISKAIKDLKNEALAAGEGSEAFNKLTSKAGELKDKLNDVNGTVRALSQNVAENLTSSFSSVARAGIGAFQSIAGAQALFGNESKDLQKTFVKLQALMSLSQGIKEFANIGQAAKDFKVVVTDIIAKIITKTTVTTADTAATEGATVAQNALNASMLANPVVALIAGITALVGVFFLMSSAEEDARKKNDELNESIIRLNANVRAITSETAKRAIDEDVANGKINESEAKLQKNRIQRQTELQALQDKYRTESRKIIEGEYDDELDRQNAFTLLNIETKKTLKAINEKYAQETKTTNAENAAEVKKEAKKSAEERAADEKKASEERIKKMQEFLANKAKLEEENATNAAIYQAEVLQEKTDAEVKAAQDIIEGEKYWNQISEEMAEQSRQNDKQRQKDKIAEAEELRQAIVASISEFGFLVGQIGGAYGTAAGNIISSFSNVFDTISKQSATTKEKIQESLTAIADTIGAISQLQQAQAQVQLSNISAYYNAQYAAIATARDQELQKEGKTGEQKAAIQNKYAAQEYQIKLQQYNAETAIKKKSFEQSQKLSIAQTIVAGANAAINAFNSLAVIPVVGTALGAIAAAGVAVLTAKQVQVIKSQKFDAGTPPTAPVFSTPAGDTATRPGSGGGSSVDPARINNFSLYGTAGKKNNLGSGSNDQQPMVVQVSISESEITTTQQKVQKYKSTSEL